MLTVINQFIVLILINGDSQKYEKKLEISVDTYDCKRIECSNNKSKYVH